MCNLRYKTPKRNSCNISHRFYIRLSFKIKKLAEEFEGQFQCLIENTEKYFTFSVPIKKEHDNDKTVTYKLILIDSFRFMSSSLSNLVGNLSKIYI